MEVEVADEGAIGSEEGCTLLSIRPINSKLLDRSSVAGDYDTFRFHAPIALTERDSFESNETRELLRRGCG